MDLYQIVGISEYKEPDGVANPALHALFNDNSIRQYMVVPNEREAGITIREAMQKLVQLDERQAKRMIVTH